MNDNEHGPGRHGRAALGASILLALLILDFPGVPAALAQEAEPLGDPSELDENDEDWDAGDEVEEFVGAPSTLDEDDDIVDQSIGDPSPIDEEDDEPGEDAEPLPSADGE